MTDLVSSAVARTVGHGPLEVSVEASESVIKVTSRGFLTPLEKTLLRRPENRDLVLLLRERLLEETRGVWEDTLRREFGLAVRSFRGEIDLDRDVRTIIIKVARDVREQ